jgi:hypothetical protein
MRKDFGSNHSVPQQTGTDHHLGAAAAAKWLVSELNSSQASLDAGSRLHQGRSIDLTD